LRCGFGSEMPLYASLLRWVGADHFTSGFAWEAEFSTVKASPTYTTIALKRFLYEEDRRKYLVRAREDLTKECGST
jgi:hypothetical protein